MPDTMIVADGASFAPDDYPLEPPASPTSVKVDVVDTQVQEIIDALDLKTIDWSNPIPAALKVGQHVETLKELKGADKLKLVQSVLRVLISKSGISEEEQSVARRFVDDVLPPVLRAAVLVSKGEFSLQKVIQQVVENPAEAIETVQEVAVAAVGCCSLFCRATPKTK